MIRVPSILSTCAILFCAIGPAVAGVPTSEQATALLGKYQGEWQVGFPPGTPVPWDVTFDYKWDTGHESLSVTMDFKGRSGMPDLVSKGEMRETDEGLEFTYTGELPDMQTWTASYKVIDIDGSTVTWSGGEHPVGKPEMLVNYKAVDVHRSPDLIDRKIIRIDEAGKEHPEGQMTLMRTNEFVKRLGALSGMIGTWESRDGGPDQPVEHSRTFSWGPGRWSMVAVFKQHQGEEEVETAVETWWYDPGTGLIHFQYTGNTGMIFRATIESIKEVEGKHVAIVQASGGFTAEGASIDGTIRLTVSADVMRIEIERFELDGKPVPAESMSPPMEFHRVKG